MLLSDHVNDYIKPALFSTHNFILSYTSLKLSSHKRVNCFIAAVPFDQFITDTERLNSRKITSATQLLFSSTPERACYYGLCAFIVVRAKLATG